MGDMTLIGLNFYGLTFSGEWGSDDIIEAAVRSLAAAFRVN
jgi:hypothetical protein